MELEAFSSMFSALDLSYIALCNIVTYLLIQSLESILGKTIKRGWKRLISAVAAIVLGFFMLCLDHEFEGLFYGFFVQFLTWDYVFKGWLNKLSKIFNDNTTEKLDNRGDTVD